MEIQLPRAHKTYKITREVKSMMNSKRRLLKVFFLGTGIFSSSIFGSSLILNNTDELVKSKDPSWLRQTIAPMSAEDQLSSINAFKASIATYRQHTNYILPLGPQSKEILKKMTSWLYSNLVADSFNQTDFPDIIQCGVSLSECSFSSHYLFDAFEYQLWSYNHDLLDDWNYTKLFFAMAQSQYFPKQKCLGTSPSSYAGFDFHDHLGKIVDKQIRKIQNRWLGFNSKKNIVQVLTKIIIGYKMMGNEQLLNIRDKFHSVSLVFPLDGAIAALADLLDSFSDEFQKKKFIETIPDRKNLYKSLLLDFICKTESVLSPSKYFDTAQEMPTETLKKQRQSILDMRSVLKSNAMSGKVVTGFEKLIGKQLARLGNRYKIENNVYDTNLCSEIDFVVTNIQTGAVIRIETDGYFHFNQNLHGSEITSDINGQTRLQTNLLEKFGKVLRISGACDKKTYEKRIKSILSDIKRFEISQHKRKFIPNSAEYNSML